jgi:hypothetical protein
MSQALKINSRINVVSDAAKPLKISNKGIKQKRLKAGWDDTYRAKVLFRQNILMLLPGRVRYCCDCLSRCYLL